MMIMMLISHTIKMAVLIRVSELSGGNRGRFYNTTVALVMACDERRSRYTHNPSLNRFLDTQQTSAALRINNHTTCLVH
jgi:hypothetical protein